MSDMRYLPKLLNILFERYNGKLDDIRWCGTRLKFRDCLTIDYTIGKAMLYYDHLIQCGEEKKLGWSTGIITTPIDLVDRRAHNRSVGPAFERYEPYIEKQRRRSRESMEEMA